MYDDRMLHCLWFLFLGSIALRAGYLGVTRLCHDIGLIWCFHIIGKLDLFEIAVYMDKMAALSDFV